VSSPLNTDHDEERERFRVVPKIPHISVVDDDDAVRESLRALLRSVRFVVEVFASAEEFLRSDRARETDCLILDVRMPGMTGFELQRHLVATHAAMPIIFITAHGDEEMRLRALKGGAVDYLLKPFSEEGLLKAVQRALAPE
jgi:FixJ family two-component response regulator